MLQDDDFRPEGAAFEDMVKETDTLLENLPGWARSQTDAIDPVPRNLPLLERQAREKEVSLVLDVSEKTWVTADKEMFETIIRNLASNAVKFTPPGGTVTIEAERIDEQVEVRIRDRGVGMDQDRLNTLFNIGVLFSSPGTANERGHGLGLQICNEFVRKNGGELKVESTPGKGSTFFFALPLSRKVSE
jgi:signal transduction histidine kinase